MDVWGRGKRWLEVMIRLYKIKSDKVAINEMVQKIAENS